MKQDLSAASGQETKPVKPAGKPVAIGHVRRLAGPRLEFIGVPVAFVASIHLHPALRGHVPVDQGGQPPPLGL